MTSSGFRWLLGTRVKSEQVKIIYLLSKRKSCSVLQSSIDFHGYYASVLSFSSSSDSSSSDAASSEEASSSDDSSCSSSEEPLFRGTYSRPDVSLKSSSRSKSRSSKSSANSSSSSSLSFLFFI